MIKMKGMTLIEVLVSIAILFVIFALVLPQLNDLKETQGLRSSTDDLVSLLNEARSKTLAQEDGTYFNVYLEEDQATLYKGASLDPDDEYTKEISFASNVILLSENISLSGTSDTITFEKLSGDTENNGTIILELESDSSKQKTITILKTGLINEN